MGEGQGMGNAQTPYPLARIFPADFPKKIWGLSRFYGLFKAKWFANLARKLPFVIGSMVTLTVVIYEERINDVPARPLT
jgi:hypothetical protein